MENLEELYISHNGLTEIQGLESNVNLTILDISNNRIKNLTNLKHLQKLQELWASYNQLESWKEVEQELGEFPELNTVYFEGNPLQKKHEVTYRNKLKILLPHLKQIDATYC